MSRHSAKCLLFVEERKNRQWDGYFRDYNENPFTGRGKHWGRVVLDVVASGRAAVNEGVKILPPDC